MKKFLLTLFNLTLLLALASYLLFTYRIPILSKSLSKTFGVPVRVDLFNISSNMVAIKDFVIYNPPELKEPKAMSIDLIEIDAPWQRFLEVNTNIQNVVLENVVANIDFYDAAQTRMNWGQILDSATIASDTPVDADAAVITIRKFTIKNLVVNLTAPNQPTKTFSIPGPIVYTDLNSRRGIPATIIADMIVRITLMEVFSIDGLAKFTGTLLTLPLTPFELLFQRPMGDPKRSPPDPTP